MTARWHRCGACPTLIRHWHYPASDGINGASIYALREQHCYVWMVGWPAVHGETESLDDAITAAEETLKLSK